MDINKIVEEKEKKSKEKINLERERKNIIDSYKKLLKENININLKLVEIIRICKKEIEEYFKENGFERKDRDEKGIVSQSYSDMYFWKLGECIKVSLSHKYDQNWIISIENKFINIQGLDADGKEFIFKPDIEPLTDENYEEEINSLSLEQLKEIKDKIYEKTKKAKSINSNDYKFNYKYVVNDTKFDKFKDAIEYL